MTLEAPRERDRAEDIFEMAFYLKDKMLNALHQNSDYRAQEKGKRGKCGNSIPGIEVNIDNAKYKDYGRRRSTQINGMDIRKHEKRIFFRITPDSEVRLEINTTEGKTERIGKVLLFVDDIRFEGKQAFDLTDSSFPELFPQKP